MKYYKISNFYPYWFILPTALIFLTFFFIPTISSFYFSLTRWNFFGIKFIGFENYVQFFSEAELYSSVINTFIFACLSSGLKTILGLLLAVLLSSNIYFKNLLRPIVFFPAIVSTIGVAITFKALMDPWDGLINMSLLQIGITGPKWLTNPDLAIFSIMLVEVWKGVGIATLIFIAGIAAIPRDYYEAAEIDGANKTQQFFNITIPMVHQATTAVIILSFIGGLRTFDMVMAMTGGGPGFASEVLSSRIFRDYSQGFFGLSTAGSVILLFLVLFLIMPIIYLLNKKQVEQ